MPGARLAVLLLIIVCQHGFAQGSKTHGQAECRGIIRTRGADARERGCVAAYWSSEEPRWAAR